MTEIADEKLSAFLDGELPSDEAAAIEKALETDEALAERLEQLSGVDVLLRGAVDALEDKMGVPSENVTDIATAAKPASVMPSVPPQVANDNWWRLPLTASVALVVGVLAGGTMFNSSSSIEQGAQSGVQLASYSADSGLGAFLETATSGEQRAIEGGQAELRLTFLDAQGQPCREFAVTASASTTQAVACRASEKAWNVEIAAVSAPTVSAGENGYRTASAGDDGFGEAVNAMMRSDAFSAEDEADLISKGWSQ